MNLNTLTVHKSWLIRAALVLLATATIEIIVVWFAHQPLLWAALIAGSLPLTLFVFVAMPLLREDTRNSRSGISK